MKNKKRPVTVIESPYAVREEKELLRNINYARACMRDSFERGEIPFASHLLYTQPGIFNDNIKEERDKEMEAGFYLTDNLADIIVVYTDLGITRGMEERNKKLEGERKESGIQGIGESGSRNFMKCQGDILILESGDCKTT